MGKKSIRENKNIYQIYREKEELTREKASERMPGISADRIEKIESGKSQPHPDEILMMAKGYRVPELCNQYCARECPIGQQYVPEVPIRDLSQITLEVLNSLNRLNREKNRLIEITVDGQITEDEFVDYLRIQHQLDQITQSVNSLRLWVDQTIVRGDIDQVKLEAARKKYTEELKNRE